MATKFDAYEELERFHNYEIPEYVGKVNKNLYTITAAVWEGAPANEVKISPQSVVDYYYYDARSMSGIRTIAGFSGDWRMVDNIAKEALEWFKKVNRPALVKAGEKYGMELRG